MREEAGARYLSPSVKQDLAKLDTDGESRRFALKSLKQVIEQLDATSMPKFLSQIGESRECGASRSYAVSLYEEVARVHKKLIKPHLPRVMSSVIRALAASGSSPQLQQACAKVTAAMARYTIDPTMSIEEAEEILRAVCDPLAEVLTGKLEPVAAGAAACIHSLIETENWKYASEETVQAVCQRITAALSEKPTRTIFHLQLASALSSMNPDPLGLYGATLLRTAEEILKTAVDSWQHRKAAAKLLQGVLIILDKETLETEVDLAIRALEGCRLDKMPQVRAAVGEALYAAKMLTSGDSIQSCKAMEQQSSSAWTKEESSLWSSKGDIEHSQSSDALDDSPVRKRIVSPTSQESNQLSFSPASTSTTESLHNSRRMISGPRATERSNSRRSRRTKALYPARGLGFNVASSRCSSRCTHSPPDSISDDAEFTPQKMDAKENIPTRITNANAALPIEEVRGHFVHVQAKSTTLRLAVPSTDAYDQLIPSLLADEIKTPESKDKPTPERAGPNAGEKSVIDCMMSPMVTAILNELTETASSIMAEDNARLGLLDSQIEEARNLKPSYKKKILPRLRLGIKFNDPDHSVPRISTHAVDNSSQHPTKPQNENHPEIRQADECLGFGCVEADIRDTNSAATDAIEDSTPPVREGSDEILHRGSDPYERTNIDLKHHNNALRHLDFTSEIPQSFITTKELLSIATSKRLMRSSHPDSRRVSVNGDDALCQHEVAVGVDMDVEASSEAGWSVRDNPMASDESFKSDNSDEEIEDRSKLPLTEPTQSNDSERDIHMLSQSESRLAEPEETKTHLEQLNTTDILQSMLLKSNEHRLVSTLEDSKGCLGSSTVMGCYMQAAPLHTERRWGWWDSEGLRARYMLVRLLSRKWKTNLCWYGEIILGGTLCVVLTLPVAMALAKALNSTPEHLVPT